MVQVSIHRLAIGDILVEDVYTKQGNKLFHKGSQISERELEILKAFLIREVSIEAKVQDHPQSMESNAIANSQDPSQRSASLDMQQPTFEEHYEQLLSLMKRVFKNTSIAENLPIVEMRGHLEKMIPTFAQKDLLNISSNKVSTEEYIFHKSITVSLISYLIASWSNFQQKDLMPIALAGLLHDIGNMGIDPIILNKPGQLTDAEMEEVKKHTVIGYNRLKNVLGITEGVKLAALQHHEREDGTGYPLGVRGDKIHIYAKVVAIADIFFAMTRERKYKNAKSPYEVLDKLHQDAFGKLDPGLVQTFIYKITQHQLGYTVRLSDGSVGKIVYSDPANPTRPAVDVAGRTVNLAQDRTLYVAEILSSQVD